PAGPNLLPQSSFRGLIGKQIRDHVRADYRNVMSRSSFAFTPKPAYIYCHSVDIEHCGRGDGTHANVVRFLIAMLHGHAVVGNYSRAPASRAQSKNRCGVVLGNVFALVVFDELFTRSNHAGSL